MASKIGEFLAGMVLPIFVQLGKEELTKVLSKLHESDPEAHKTVLVSMYPPIDVHLEKLVTQSKSKWDNPFVAALKESIEASAEEFGIELPNLDAGQPGD